MGQKATPTISVTYLKQTKPPGIKSNRTYFHRLVTAESSEGSTLDLYDKLGQGFYNPALNCETRQWRWLIELPEDVTPLLELRSAPSWIREHVVNPIAQVLNLPVCQVVWSAVYHRPRLKRRLHLLLWCDPAVDRDSDPSDSESTAIAASIVAAYRRVRGLSRRRPQQHAAQRSMLREALRYRGVITLGEALCVARLLRRNPEALGMPGLKAVPRAGQEPKHAPVSTSVPCEGGHAKPVSQTQIHPPAEIEFTQLLLRDGFVCLPRTLFRYKDQLNLDPLTLGKLVTLLAYAGGSAADTGISTFHMLLRSELEAEFEYGYHLVKELEDAALVRVEGEDPDQVTFSLVPFLARLRACWIEYREVMERRAPLPIPPEILAAERLLQRTLSARERATLDEWRKAYGFGPDMVEAVIKTGLSEGVTRFPYLKQIAATWGQEGIRTPEQAAAYVQRRRRDDLYRHQFVINQVGRSLTRSERSLVMKWTCDWHFTEDVIIKAIQEAKQRGAQGLLPYANRILESWLERGLMTIEAIANVEHSKVTKLESLLGESRFVLSVPIEQLNATDVSILIACLSQPYKRFPPELEPLLLSADLHLPVKPVSSSNPFSERVPPQNLEAEQRLLGGLMIDSQPLGQMLSYLTDTDFYADKHQAIFAVIRQLQLQREPVDLITVQAGLHARGVLDDVGGLMYLTSLINLADCERIDQYARIVYYKAVQRKTWGTGTAQKAPSGKPL